MSDFEDAYYSFMYELTERQVASLKLVLNGTDVRKLYIDGGFNANPIFVEMLRDKLPGLSIETMDFGWIFFDNTLILGSPLIF